MLYLDQPLFLNSRLINIDRTLNRNLYYSIHRNLHTFLDFNRRKLDINWLIDIDWLLDHCWNLDVTNHLFWNLFNHFERHLFFNLNVLWNFHYLLNNSLWTRNIFWNFHYYFNWFFNNHLFNNFLWPCF